MSVWMCPDHGLYGGLVLCPRCGKSGTYVTFAPAQADTRRMAETALAGSGRSPSGTVGAEGDDAPTPSNPLHPKE